MQWAIEGAVKWSHDGLKIPPDVLTASEAYLAEEDIIGQFIEVIRMNLFQKTPVSDFIFDYV